MVQCLSADATPQCQLDLAWANRHFAQATPQEILAWCRQHWPDGLIQTSSFSLPVIPHMLYHQVRPQPPIPVVFLDTLHHFPETLDTLERATIAYDLDVRIYRPQAAQDQATFAARYGERLWQKNVDWFHYVTKVEPLQRALKDLNVQAWITGRRRDQSQARRCLPIFEQDPQGRIKINPLAPWTRKQVWTYIVEHQVIYNPLHDQGYASIGDQPLTTPIAQGEDERAGRWRGSSKTECGIHG